MSVPNGHTYPLRCFAPQWARFDNRHSTSAPTPTLAVVSDSGAGIVSRPGASVSFVSDGPISSNSGRNGGKNAGRNCVSALPQRATPDSDFPHLLAGITFHHRCRSKGLRVRSPARRLTRPLAPATAEIFRSCRRSRRRGYFAQRRKRFLCLRRPHFFQQRKKWGKERRQKLRFCTSSARYGRL